MISYVLASSRFSYLEDVGQISEVEDVMELYSSWQEIGGDLVVKGQCTSYESSGVLLHITSKTVEGEMLRQDTDVDCL